VAQARVLSGHPHHQGGEDVVDRWPSGPVWVGPSSADEAAMPAQDRVRGDQTMGPQCSGQPPYERRTRPGPPSPGGRGLVRRRTAPRDAVRAARRRWRRTCDTTAGPTRASAGRSSTAAAVTHRDHVRSAIRDHRSRIFPEELVVMALGQRAGGVVSVRFVSRQVVTCAASAASRIRQGQCAPGVPVPGVVHARQR
jgi:hypothetical protein